MKKICMISTIALAVFCCFSALAIPEDSLVYMTGGGTNKKAVQAIVDEAISNTVWYIDWEEGSFVSDGSTNYFPCTKEYQILGNNACSFTVASDENIKCQAMFECYSDVDTPVYVASSESTEGRVYSLVFTCSTIGQPIDFKLRITLMPYQGVEGTASKVIVFNLRRTF